MSRSLGVILKPPSRYHFRLILVIGSPHPRLPVPDCVACRSNRPAPLALRPRPGLSCFDGPTHGSLSVVSGGIGAYSLRRPARLRRGCLFPSNNSSTSEFYFGPTSEFPEAHATCPRRRRTCLRDLRRPMPSIWGVCCLSKLTLYKCNLRLPSEKELPVRCEVRCEARSWRGIHLCYCGQA